MDYFYPRSPCGERRISVSNVIHLLHFYPRSPCGERLRGWTLNINGPIFLSTLSLRRATTEGSICFDSSELFLSTLSLRRATSFGKIMSVLSGYFYPRSPCGERPVSSAVQSPASQFLSTLSLRRATSSIDDLEPSSTRISIHALLAESDE